MPADPLEEMRRLVIDDRAVRSRLVSVTDRSAFTAELLRIARERGVKLSSDQIAEGLRAARRERLERWV